MTNNPLDRDVILSQGKTTHLLGRPSFSKYALLVASRGLNVFATGKSVI